ncbi:hypothetical protein K491DRAFT_587689 [Lophiostoma macrostomum CBS 122681]|uniref:Zn(2)-C6 fungal-type domain-containing protein n=1 Tax=Lophiostoma macrostomum CBS 122681 TaxID=1314788 RepID=A0A6A6TM61_9PLEO|nr:hypothetical protein K491DRAFT_587689 [Lophiostoma macrostomum CBS 122681]
MPATPKQPRRPHVKSRSGCQNCKKRKVKCGEERPSCRNCSRRGDLCDLSDETIVPNALEVPSTVASTASALSGSHTPQVLSRAPSFVDDGNGMGALTVLDLELLHHYTTSTCPTLSSDPIIRNWLLVNVPQLGFSHSYVLYSVLALAASHLAHFRPNSRQYYYAEATARHTIATSIAAPILSAISTDNLIPMYSFSILTLFISFASLGHENDLLFDASNVIPGWFTLFRGVRTVLEFNERAIRSSSISFLFSKRPGVNMPHESKQLDHDALKEFQEYIVTSTSEDEHTRQKLLDAFQDLKVAFYPFYGEELSNEGKVRSIFTWLYRISDEYIDMLRQGNSNALCILAFFSVLLHRLEYNWWLKGWSTHLIDRIYAALDHTHRCWIRWPIQEIGWVPQRDVSQSLFHITTPTT